MDTMKKIIGVVFTCSAFCPYLHSSGSDEEGIEDIYEYKDKIKQILLHDKGSLNLKGVESSKARVKSHPMRKFFEISTNNGHYIFRRFSRKDSVNKKAKEIKTAQIVSKEGFGPEFIGAPKNNEFYIVAFAGNPITYQDLTDDNLVKIGKLLRKMHDFKCYDEGISQEKRIQRHYERCKNKGVALPSKFDEFYKDYIKQNKDRVPAIGFCHGNLIPSNFRINKEGEFVLINWKNAGNGDKFEDIGYFVLTNGLNDDQIETLMEGYLGRKPNTDDIEKVKFYANRTCLLTSLVWFEAAEDNTDRRTTPLKNRVKAIDEAVKIKQTDVLEYPRKSSMPHIFSENKIAKTEYAVSAWQQYALSLALKKSLFAKIKKWVTALFD